MQVDVLVEELKTSLKSPKDSKNKVKDSQNSESKNEISISSLYLKKEHSLRKS